MTRTLACAAAAALLAASAGAAAQEESRTKVLRDTQWNLAALEGRCQLRVWVDDRARVRLRGDEIWVQTRSGQRSFDQGSHCNQPLPFHGVEDFRVTAERGRGGIDQVQSPTRRNNYTGSVLVNDPQDGGAVYVIDIARRNEGPRRASAPPSDPFPWFDELRACQDKVRSEFLRRNRGDAYLEFVGIPDRDDLGRNRDLVRGEAYARNRQLTRPVTYECVLNERTNVVESVAYRYPAGTAGQVR